MVEPARRAMTEDDAKARWCPFARTVERWPDGLSASRNRVVVGEGDSFALVERLVGTCCIASACMAWRVTGSKFKDARTGALSDVDLTGNGQWIETGFCGLAGSAQ